MQIALKRATKGLECIGSNEHGESALASAGVDLQTFQCAVCNHMLTTLAALSAHAALSGAADALPASSFSNANSDENRPYAG